MTWTCSDLGMDPDLGLGLQEHLEEHLAAG